MELAEIWKPQRGYVWMRRWLETHRMRKAARDAAKDALAKQIRRPRPPRQNQHLPFVWDTS